MKNFGLLFASALALLTLAACNDKEEPDNNQKATSDESYYASQATVTSSDSNFTANDSGGEIRFKTEGGSVTLNVSCGCDWFVENNASDLFATSFTSTTLIITAEHNTVEKDLTGTVTLRTSNQRIAFATITITQTAYGAPEISVETNEWHVPAVGILTAEIAVKASEEWTAESADEWLAVVKSGEGICLTAVENEDIEARSTKVTLTCTDGIRTEYEYIAVSQDGRAHISLSKEYLSLVSEAGTYFMDVESNYEWEYSYDAPDNWITATRDGDGLTISVTANETGKERESVIVFAAGDGIENIFEAQVVIIQYGASTMIFEFSITGDTDKTIILPFLHGEEDKECIVNCTVDWGDGTVETITSTLPTHTYNSEGVYNVCVSGTVTALCYRGIYSSDTPNYAITAVKQWGNTGLTSMFGALYCCSSITSLPTDTSQSFKDVESFHMAFYGMSSLETVPSGLLDHCPEVEDFAYLFSRCTALKTIPKGLFDYCPRDTTFYDSFYNCNALAEIPEGLFDNCPEVTSFRYVFYKCSSLKSVPKKLFANNTKVTDAYALFYNCYDLVEVGEGAFDGLSKAENFRSIFYNCTSLETIPSGLFDNCLAATDFYCAFYSCSKLESIPKGLFDHCTEVTNFGYVFYGCKALEIIPEGLFASFTKVTNFKSVFYNCSGITEIPEGLFDHCYEATDLGYMFYGLSLVTEIPVGLFDGCTKVTSFECTFYGCSSIEGVPEGLFDNCPEVTNFSHCFQNCSALVSVPAGLFDKCPEVEDFNAVFIRCTNLTSVPADIFSKNLKVTNFQSTFREDAALTGESPYDVIDGNRVHLYERASHPDIYAVPTSTSNCFMDCTGLSDYSSIPSAWGGGGN